MIRCARLMRMALPDCVMFWLVAPQCTQPPASSPATRASSSMSGMSGCPWIRMPSMTRA